MGMRRTYAVFVKDIISTENRCSPLLYKGRSSKTSLLIRSALHYKYISAVICRKICRNKASATRSRLNHYYAARKTRDYTIPGKKVVLHRLNTWRVFRNDHSSRIEDLTS
jgi:hypothetical protein